MQWPKVGDRANAILVDAVSSAHLIARKYPISTVIAQGVVVHQVEMVQKGGIAMSTWLTNVRLEVGEQVSQVSEDGHIQTLKVIQPRKASGVC